MKHRFTFTTAALLAGVALLAYWPVAPGLGAAGTSAPGGIGMLLPAFERPEPPADQPEYTYVGTKKCKSCHLDVHKSWAKTKMGLAFETLKPGHAKEAKATFGLDATKDYTTDKTCLKCHVTGYGKPGGYEIPDPKNKRAMRKSKDLHGVGCESCHGPGSEYVKILEEIDTSRRSYSVEELHAKGMRKIDKNACISCHNEESPTVNPDQPFDFDKIMKEEEEAGDKASRMHMHKPLELRIEQ
jgi:formate-dependent nitrite reductase cytochrome c552 subunit